MSNLELVFPEIFLSLSIMFLLILGVFKKNSSNLIHNLSMVFLLITGILILTNQLQALGYYLLNILPFLQNFG